MRSIQVRNISIGDGMPKICVPLTASSENELLSEAALLSTVPADIAEWRVDMFGRHLGLDDFAALLASLRDRLIDVPLILTYRTSREGGSLPISSDDYLALNLAAIRSSCIDILDVELSSGDAVISELAKESRAHGVKLMLSYHNFQNTPCLDEIIAIYRRMQDVGSDISKIAVMPNSKADVATLLNAASIMDLEYADRPYIAISMSELGLESRLIGGLYGSCITYASMGAGSAPGQIDIHDIKEHLSSIYSED